MNKNFKKIIFSLIAIFLLAFLINQTITCQSRVDKDYSSFKVCVKRLFGRDNPLPEPELKPENTVRFLEGWNINNMADYLAKEDLFSKTEFISAATKDNYEELISKFSFLEDKPAEASLEGYLYPDTYRIFSDSKPNDLILRMLNNFDQKLTKEMREAITEQNKTIYEILTMAALIEREVAINYQNNDNQDAKIVAGIFWQRIKNRQALQSCATLAYILGVNKEQYSLEDTKIESPYNTYLYPGLPPGPIANPGILAIEAAIYPISSDYNYFLTPSRTKEVIYSRTYQEHLDNKYKYIK
jgi:UPF0755 protein